MIKNSKICLRSAQSYFVLGLKSRYNKIELALDQDYIKKYFQKQNVYSLKDKLKKIEIKRLYRIDPNAYSIKYPLFFKNRKEKDIFATGRKIRKNRKSYDLLKYLLQKKSLQNFNIPNVLFCGFSSHLIFYEYIKGKNMIHFIKRNKKKELEIFIKKSAEQLAKLHNLKIKNSKFKKIPLGNLRKDKEKAKYYLKVLKKNLPEHILEIKKSLEKILIFKKDLFKKKKKEFILIHGDFQPTNLLFDGKKAKIIDFEHSFFYRPAFDLAFFLTNLEVRFYQAQRNDFSYFKKIFFDSYFSKKNKLVSFRESFIKQDIQFKKEFKIFQMWVKIEILVAIYDYPESETYKESVKKVFLKSLKKYNKIYGKKSLF